MLGAASADGAAHLMGSGIPLRWPTPPGVRAWITPRSGGVSRGPYGAYAPEHATDSEADRRTGHPGESGGGLNLGMHTLDRPADVQTNRQRVVEATGCASAAWLEQVHGTTVVEAAVALAALARGQACAADASFTTEAGQLCVVMVADCLPILLSDTRGRAVGAVHAGWRGLCAGIAEASAERVARAAGAGASLTAYLGPCIGAGAFEVGAEVREQFMEAALAVERDAVDAAFVARAPAARGASHARKYLADLRALARIRLARAGVAAIEASEDCTFSDPLRFYSYRRNPVTGRFAAAIWLEPKRG